MVGISHLKRKIFKKITLASDHHDSKCNRITDISAKLEYFTSFDISCEFHDLQSTVRCTPRLKFFNVRLTINSSYNLYHFLNRTENEIISTLYLQTVILSFGPNDQTTFSQLAKHLKAMPVLRQLEIKAHSPFLDAKAWKSLLKLS
ncbi:unnamed protein product [Rotaria magnacalcarata]|uniref:Uncharacterized protein n=1 Tax=Rotaria magnacalcarata TaxID=392030 RepID=A0A816LQL8_9BILA|nr:unnamed protein product [Rotaria magnacalcarata]